MGDRLETGCSWLSFSWPNSLDWRLPWYCIVSPENKLLGCTHPRIGTWASLIPPSQFGFIHFQFLRMQNHHFSSCNKQKNKLQQHLATTLVWFHFVCCLLYYRANIPCNHTWQEMKHEMIHHKRIRWLFTALQLRLLHFLIVRAYYCNQTNIGYNYLLIFYLYQVKDIGLQQNWVWGQVDIDIVVD